MTEQTIQGTQQIPQEQWLAFCDHLRPRLYRLKKIS